MAATLVVSGCSSSASKTPAPASPSIDASYCLSGIPDYASHVTRFKIDDQTVEAFTTGDGPVGIVLAHQAGGDLCQWRNIWPDLTAKGYKVMAISMHGDIVGDVTEAAARLRSQGVKKVVLIGASMGGSAALAAAGQITPPVQAVVSLSAPSMYNTADALDSVKTFQVPVAYFAGKQDTRFADDAQQLYDATTEKDKSLHIVDPSLDHGVDLWPTVKAEVFDFVAKHVS